MKKIKSFLSFFILFIGFFFYFINNNPHYHSANGENGHMNHGQVQIPDGVEIPTISVTVTEDLSGSYLLKVETTNFEFAPEKVGTMTPSYNEGHAHLYINGEKINRLYGNYYSLGILDPGKHTITVSLHSNNHGALVHKGTAVESSKVVEVSS